MIEFSSWEWMPGGWTLPNPIIWIGSRRDMDTKTYLGSFRKVRNAYPLMTVGGGLRPSACSDFGQTRVYFNPFRILGAATFMVQMYGVVMSLPHGRVLEIRFLPD